MEAKNYRSDANPYPVSWPVLGARICLRRVKLGLTQRDLVNEKYYERMLNDVESGLVAPSAEYLAYLAEHLQTTPEEWLIPGSAAPALTNPAVESDPVNIFEFSPSDWQLMTAQSKVETGQAESSLAILERLDPAELPLELRAVYHRVKGHAFQNLRRFQEAETELNRGLSLLEENFPSHFLQIEVVRNLIGGNFYKQNRVKEAQKHHQRCLEAVLQGHITNPRFRLRLYSNLANEHYLLGNYNLALNLYKKEALPLVVQDKDDLAKARIYWGMALAYRDSDDLAQAVLFMDLSAKLFKKHQDWNFAVQAQDQLGLIFVQRKDYRRAEEVLLDAMDMAGGTVKDSRTLAYLHNNLAYLYLRSGDLSQALDYSEKGIKLGREVGDKLLLSQALATLGDIELARHEPQKSFEVYEEAIKVLGQTEQFTARDRLMESYADALREHGYFVKALDIRIRMRDRV